MTEQHDPEQASAALAWIEDRWNDAATPLRPHALAALYAVEGLFFGGLPEHFVGQAEIENYFSYYVDKLAAMSLRFRDQHSIVTDNILTQGFVDFAFYLPDGRVTYASLRGTLVLRRKKAGWEILLHHFSPPPLVVPVPL